MREQLLSVQERILSNGIVLDLRGDLTKQSEPVLLLRRTWEEGLGGKPFLVLNFSEITYINSSGIAVLIRLVRTGTRTGSFETFAYGLSPHYQKLFKMVGLLTYMTVYPDEYAVMERIG